MSDFSKSDVGAQSAWKGFSAQTLYISQRLVSDKDGYEYYPEDIEDLVVKHNGCIIEAVQVKNISSDLTLTSLASSETSKRGEGFFKRMCSIHADYPLFHSVRVVYFNNLGSELLGVKNNTEADVKGVKNKLVEKHNLSESEADWIIKALIFEKADVETLDQVITQQIKEYVPVMAAPDLAKELLIQYISNLSRAKGYTTLTVWKDQINKIGEDISAIDGFYKEYSKSLVRLNELNLNANSDELSNEYIQGVSAQPSHIRQNLDIKRDYWIKQISDVIEEKGVAIVKGVSGQGKSSLCYRYLIDTYPENCVFCVRSLVDESRVLNMTAALDALGKHNSNLIIYIDVNPGETNWVRLLQELQFRGLTIPVLISIREEDFNFTSLNGYSIKYGLLELSLSRDEAKYLYEKYVEANVGIVHRTFDEAWNQFGGKGPLIEFLYLITNNQTLTQRLNMQIEALLKEDISDEWFELLQLVSYAGKLGCSVNIRRIKKVIGCSNIQAAIHRFKDEYLIRVIDENTLEALHPVRAQILTGILENESLLEKNEVVFKLLSCTKSNCMGVILLDYFTQTSYSLKDVEMFSHVQLSDWSSYGNLLKTMLWLDTKRFVENNIECYRDVSERLGSGWFCFLPNNLSGIETESTLFAQSMLDWKIMDQDALQREIENVKSKLNTFTLDYQATDCWLKNCMQPDGYPCNDDERSQFGYSLFWLSKRKYNLSNVYDNDLLSNAICDGAIESSADAIRGVFEHDPLYACYKKSLEIIENKLFSEYKILEFEVSPDAVSCKFVPPLKKLAIADGSDSNSNQYWRIKMLDILKQLYPDKEYISIELIGVHLLDDLGIKPMDYTLHIHRSHIYSNWVTDINRWAKNRIDYIFRPLTWKQYVCRIDEVRKNLSELIIETIKLIDDIYGKGRYRSARWENVESKRRAFLAQVKVDFLLPQIAVDPYCLYAEGNVQKPVAEFFTMRQLISVKNYEKFRKLWNDYVSAFQNYYNQFAEVLSVRVKKEKIETVGNLNLALFNIFTAAQKLEKLQKEYSRLFSRYSNLRMEFNEEELERTLTLLNVWKFVIENEPKRLPIAYDAKQKYRKGRTLFTKSIETVTKEMGAETFRGEKFIYFICNCGLDFNGIENEYKKLLQSLKSAFNVGQYVSSDRWHAECQPLQLAFVPAINDVALPVAYTIPYYRIFDANSIPKDLILFPTEIEPSANEVINCGKAMQRNQLIRLLSTTNMLLKRYSEILQISVSSRCSGTLQLIQEELISQVTVSWEEFERLKETACEVSSENNMEVEDAVCKINMLYDCYDEIISSIKNKEHIAEIIAIIENIVPYVLLLNIIDQTRR